MKEIDGWQIHSQIGRGGQAGVYKTTKGEGGEICAIKLIKTKTKQKRARFVKEIRRHLKLTEKKAPNIMPILAHNLDAFEKGGTIGYIVMPMAATTLQEQTATFILRPELSLEVFQGIVNGIKEAHSIGIIHRDLKPSNILFEDESLRIPLISDFGICFVKEAPERNRITRSSEIVGSKFFMAPEQERGGQVDVKKTTDIYSLGKLLHYMTTGRHLYREKLDEAFDEAELDRDPRFGIILDDILRMTIVENPDDRVPSAEELIEITKRVCTKCHIPFTGLISKPEEAPVEIVSPQNKIVIDIYKKTVNDFNNGKVAIGKIHFDEYRGRFKQIWSDMKKKIELQPDKSADAAYNLINEQPECIGLILAMTRLDKAELFQDFKKFLEIITYTKQEQSRYEAVNAVPQVFAGFLYMTACLSAFWFQSWKILQLLLCQKFEWYYLSGNPVYSFGFEHPYFFHSEALNRNAVKIHELYRKLLFKSEIMEILNIDDKEGFLNIYLQIHFIMCLRGAQEIQAGNGIMMFAEFGRFYASRITPLIEKIRNDAQFLGALSKLFDEDVPVWVELLDDRIKIIKADFYGGSPYMWKSITKAGLSRRT